ncbi:uncharacterized protein LOC119067637 [Bradysia coprophila]|uniref:uncharacterized protein LOC119067637 n=1 Tax=Bradysia coprophila TaxID=38358 RepID=UPI00187DD9E2|nr:uncharacterized protein LOC119067637 [Bradysia coprophila]
MVNETNILIQFKEKIFKKNKQKSGTALDGMNGVMKCINFFAYVSGIEFIDDWRKNVRIGFAVIVLSLVLTCATYTICVFFPSTDNIILVGGIAFNSTVWTKLIFVSVKHEKFMSLVQYIYKVLKCEASAQRERIFMNVTKNIYYHLEINVSGIFAGLVFYSAFPCYEFFFNGKLTLVSPMLLPYVNPNHIRGYLITSAYNIFVVTFSLTISIATSSLFFAFVDAYNGLVCLLEHDFGTFDVMCTKNESRRTYDVTFRNLMMKLMDLVRFSCYMGHLFSFVSTVQVAMSCLVVVSCLGAFLAFDYVGGLGAAVCLYTEMLMYCYIGQLLDNTNKQIATVICNAKWYTYKVKYQRDMMTALYVAQKVKPILLANMFSLNFATGLKITKNIYTLIMFMLEMFN